MQTATRPLGRGERAPDFVLACQDGTPTRFYAHAGGRPAVLLFYDAAGVDDLLRFAEALTDGAGSAVALFAVQRGTPAMTPQVVPGRASLVLQDATATAHQVLALLDACLPQVAPLEITAQAPVLLIPYVLDQDLCQSLIHVWETQG